LHPIKPPSFSDPKNLSNPDLRSKSQIENGYWVENGCKDPTKINEITSERLKALVFSQLYEGVEVLDGGQRTI